MSAILLRCKNYVSFLPCVFVAVALIASFMNQYNDLYLLVNTPASILDGSAELEPAAPSSPASKLSELFGQPVPINASAISETNLQLELVGSFVNDAPMRSAALIKRQGNIEQRFLVGEKVGDGIYLSAVHKSHVELLNNGRRERLDFLRLQAKKYRMNMGPDERKTPELHKLSQLQQDEIEMFHERMRVLREQMDGTVYAAW